MRILAINVRSMDVGKKTAMARLVLDLSLDITAIVETWVPKGSCLQAADGIQSLVPQARCFFTGVEDPHPHLGVGIILSSRMAKHYQGMEECEGTAIKLDLRFKNQTLIIIAIYLPPGQINERRRQRTERMAMHWLTQAEASGSEVIMIGDLNDQMSPLDGPPGRRSTVRQSELSRSIMAGEFLMDVWRRRFPRARLATYPRESPKRRLDYMWATPSIAQNEEGVGALDMTDVMIHTDHLAVVMESSPAWLTHSPPHHPRAGHQRLRAKDCTAETWETYKRRTDEAPEELNGKMDDQRELSYEEAKGTYPLLVSHLQRCGRDLPRGGIPKMRIESLMAQMGRLSRVARRLSQSLPQGYGRACKVLFGWGRDMKRMGIKDELIHEVFIAFPIPHMCPCPPWLSQMDIPLAPREPKALLNRLRHVVGMTHKARCSERQFQFIRRAVTRREDNFQGDLGGMVRSLKRRPGERKEGVDRALITVEGEPYLTTSAEEVKREVLTHFSHHFAKRQPDMGGGGDGIAQFFSPLQGIQRDIYDGLMDPADEEEFASALSCLSKGKAPGPSGLEAELIQRASQKAKDLLRRILNAFIHAGRVPSYLTRGRVVLIPKVDNWKGQLSKLRPICLLEVAVKLMNGVVFGRLQKMIWENDLLKGLNLGFRPGFQAPELSLAMQGLAESCRLGESSFDLVSMDVSKAYDSVSIEVLEAALHRIHMPPKAIRYILNQLGKRKVTFSTSYGQTEELHPESGLPQGDIGSPLLWNIVYDSLLCYLAREVTPFTFQPPPRPLLPRGTSDPGPRMVGINCAAYADDLTIMGAGRRVVQETVARAERWFRAVDIKINPEKTRYMAEGPTDAEEGELPPLMIGQVAVDPISGPGSPLRILGMFLVSNGDYRAVMESAGKYVRWQCQVLSRKHITDRMAAYMASAVMIPAVSYRLQGLPVSDGEMRSIQGPMLTLVKHTAGLPSTFPSSVIWSRLGYGVPRLGTVWEAKAIDMVVKVMNGDKRLRSCMEARIMMTEETLKLPFPMLSVPSQVRIMGHRSPKDRRPLWVATVARAMSIRGIRLMDLRRDEKQSDLPSLMPLILTKKSLVYMWKRGLHSPHQVFQLGHEGMKVHPRIGKGTMIYKEATEWLDGRGRGDEGEKLRRWMRKWSTGWWGRRVGEEEEPMGLTREKIKERYGVVRSEEEDDEVEVYTDGSLQKCPEGGWRMGFAAVFIKGGEVMREMAGWMKDGEKSSTLAEGLAMALAIAVAPPSTKLTLYSDSRAALAALTALQGTDVQSRTRCETRSPCAFLWRKLSSWIERRGRRVEGKWVRGHTGNRWNERADALAGKAAKEGEGRWKWEMKGDACEGTEHWMGWEKGSLIQGGSSRVVKGQDSALLRDSMSQQIAESMGPSEMEEEKALDMVKALFWAVDRKAKVQKKNARRRTNGLDRGIRGFGLEMLFTSPPVMKRQTAWYPEIYQEVDSWKCPRCEEEEETLPHLLSCWKTSEVIQEWMKGVSVMVKEKKVEEEVAVAIVEEEERGEGGGFGTRGVPPMGWWTLAEQEVRRAGKVKSRERRERRCRAQLQYMYRLTLHVMYRLMWVPRCKRQQDKERRRGVRETWKRRREERERERERGVRREGVERAEGRERREDGLPRRVESFPRSEERRKTLYRRYKEAVEGG